MVTLAACVATPPVQEMSDARQAVHAAREAQVREPERLEQAERLLHEARLALEAGAYEQARTHAVAAKQAAIDARTGASRHQD